MVSLDPEFQWYHHTPDSICPTTGSIEPIIPYIGIVGPYGPL